MQFLVVSVFLGLQSVFFLGFYFVLLSTFAICFAFFFFWFAISGCFWLSGFWVFMVPGFLFSGFMIPFFWFSGLCFPSLLLDLSLGLGP